MRLLQPNWTGSIYFQISDSHNPITDHSYQERRSCGVVDFVKTVITA